MWNQNLTFREKTKLAISVISIVLTLQFKDVSYAGMLNG